MGQERQGVRYLRLAQSGGTLAGSFARVVAHSRSLELPPFPAEDSKAPEAGPLKGELQSGSQHAETVRDTSPKINRRSLFEILRRTRNLSDAVAKVHALCEHLVVDDEIVGVFGQRKFGQNLAAERPIPGVVLGQLHSQEQVLKRREQPIEDVLVKRHASAQRGPADDA